MHPQITAYDIERFTCGDCHLLARAINRLTGWPIHSFIWKYTDSPELHAFVIMPDGRALDVEGARSLSELRSRWHTDMKIKPMSWERLLRAWDTDNYGYHSRRRAREVARLLLDDLARPPASGAAAIAP